MHSLQYLVKLQRITYSKEDLSILRNKLEVTWITFICVYLRLNAFCDCRVELPIGCPHANPKTAKLIDKIVTTVANRTKVKIS